MLVRLGRFAVARRKLVLILTAIAFVAAGAIGGGVAEHLSSGGFNDPAAESTHATELLEDEFGAGDPNFIVLVRAKEGTVDTPAVARAGAELTARLSREDGVAQVLSYWSLGKAQPFRSTDGTKALIIARIEGETEDDIDAAAERLTPIYSRDTDVVDLGVGGFAAVFNEIGTKIEADLQRAESIAIPITLVLLVLVFGSVVAALLPLAIGGLAIIGTFFVLRVIAELTQVSIFSLNMTTAMGLGLAIDYSLFVVSRFREELHHGHEPADAVVRTVDTAGRTVLFSALTVAASLGALMIFPFAFLRSFAYAGIPVVMLAATGSIVTLPALLAALGRNVDKWSLLHRTPKEVGDGTWHRVAIFVMRRPLPIATAVIALLFFLGAPAFGMNLGLPDDRVQNPAAETRQVHDDIRASFDTDESGAANVVLSGLTAAAADAAPDVSAYAGRLSRVPGVGRVDTFTGSFLGGRQVAPPTPLAAAFVARDGQSVWLRAVPTVEPVSRDGERMVEALRAVDAPGTVRVGGPSAMLVDSRHALLADVPLAAVLIAVITFVVLFLMFGSVLVPAKAFVLNLLSLSATFGAMVWIFQEGHLSGALDFTPRDALDISTPILMFCIAFGLSMDYEVFLLSRIKEEYDRTGDNEGAVAAGLERTGRIVTAAAALISVVFLAMISSSIAFIKLFGLGLALAVIVDATLVRATLVPAFMRLAGAANWWAPAPMRRIYERFGFSEISPEPGLAAALPPTPAPDDLVIDLREPAPEPVAVTATNGDRANGDRRRPLTAPGRPGVALVATDHERARAREHLDAVRGASSEASR